VAPWRIEGKSYPSWLYPISATTWRAAFAEFVDTLRVPAIYVTVDLDCLEEGDALTNWESGRFVLDDLVWALALLRQKVRIVGGDLCGAFSATRYGSRFQRLAGRFDHPRQRLVTDQERCLVNGRALETIWPRLIRG
jgi:hypothetical protein